MGGAALLCLLVAGPSIYRACYLNWLLAGHDSRVMAAGWVDAHVAPGSSIYQSGTDWAHAQFAPSAKTLENRLARARQQGRSGRLLQVHLDQVNAGVLDRPGYDIRDLRDENRIWETSDLPDIVVLYDSPLMAYTPIPDALAKWTDAHYSQAVEIAGVGQGIPSSFDQLDAFFVPFTDLGHAVRTGPNIRIFARNSLP